MYKKSPTDQASLTIATPCEPSVDHDGYIRLSIPELYSLSFEHLVSGLDEEQVFALNTNQTAITGYTEWISQSHPTVSIGWDWSLGALPHPTLPRRMGYPRSNLMLIDTEGCDYNDALNEALLMQWIDQLVWQETVSLTTQRRYPPI